MGSPSVDIETLLSKTDSFLRKMYAVRDHLGLEPQKEHIATCINYADLQEMRADFVKELVGTVMTYVYSPDRQEKLVQLFIEDGRDRGNAWTQLYIRAREKFRPSSLQGQFSELLLFNLLQHYYKAAPLLRKMPITTNPALERNGADAIHLALQGGKYILYIGEAKTYNRKNGSLREALKSSISDVIEKHYKNHRSELNLYSYEDFIPAPLEDLAREYLEGKRDDVEIHLVCIVTYDDKNPRLGGTREEKLDSIISALRKDLGDAMMKIDLEGICGEMLPRMNYIIFPVNEMSDLIETFQKTLGRH